MATSGYTYPPKFSENLLYPAIYNLDELDMPQSNYSMGQEYFHVRFPGYDLNVSPQLTFGKHTFDIFLDQTPTPGIPKLKIGSRILFEFKDSAGTIIFSDVTPYRQGNSFTAYCWIKRDPLRTYDDIVDGFGTLTIAGKVEISDVNWRNKYNVRAVLPIEIITKKPVVEGAPQTYYSNTSPIIFQHNSVVMGSGSGLFMSQSYEEVEVDSSGNGEMDSIELYSYIHISASKLKTYGGQVDNVEVAYQLQVEGSGTQTRTTDTDNSVQFSFLGNYAIRHDSSSKFENDIHLDYSDGINSLRDVWRHSLSTIPIPSSGDYGIKFRLKFFNIETTPAEDPFGVGTFSLIYPPGDQDFMIIKDFQDIIAPLVSQTPSASPIGDKNVLFETNAGAFSFKSNYISIAPGRGGIRYGTDGEITGWGLKQENCAQSQFGCDDPPTL